MQFQKSCKRCAWVNLQNEPSINYHDKEWGAPIYEDGKLFEMLVLEGAQAGLSWQTILNKRENYINAFDNFNFIKISSYDQNKQIELLKNEGIVRNKLKIKSVIENAKVLLKIKSEYSSFSNYIWSFLNHKPIMNNFKLHSEIPEKTELSVRISKNLKAKGMNFVGPTIIYAFMQAVGMVNDHTINCFRHKEIKNISK